MYNTFMLLKMARVLEMYTIDTNLNFPKSKRQAHPFLDYGERFVKEIDHWRRGEPWQYICLVISLISSIQTNIIIMKLAIMLWVWIYLCLLDWVMFEFMEINVFIQILLKDHIKCQVYKYIYIYFFDFILYFELLTV